MSWVGIRLDIDGPIFYVTSKIHISEGLKDEASKKP